MILKTQKVNDITENIEYEMNSGEGQIIILLQIKFVCSSILVISLEIFVDESTLSE